MIIQQQKLFSFVCQKRTTSALAKAGQTNEISAMDQPQHMSQQDIFNVAFSSYLRHYIFNQQWLPVGHHQLPRLRQCFNVSGNTETCLMRNYTSTLLLLIGMNFASSSQEINKDFEGYISYEHKFVSHSKNYDENTDKQLYGTHSDYYYKEGNYKWLTYDCFYLMDLHLRQTGTNYFLTSNSDTLFTINSATPSESVVNFTITKSEEKILGHSCKVLTIRTRSLNPNDSSVLKRQFYYSNDVRMNPEFFKNRNRSSQNFISSKMQALPLRIVLHRNDNDIIWEAKKIVNQKLDDTLFQLPPKPKLKEW